MSYLDKIEKLRRERNFKWSETSIGGKRLSHRQKDTTFFVSPMKNSPGKWHMTAQIGGPNGERYCIGENYDTAEAAMKFIEDFITEGM